MVGREGMRYLENLALRREGSGSAAMGDSWFRALGAGQTHSAPAPPVMAASFSSASLCFSSVCKDFAALGSFHPLISRDRLGLFLASACLSPVFMDPSS